MKAYFSRRNINRIVSGLLVFWLSGLILLFCCEIPKAQMAEADNCPLAKISHCDKKSVAENISQFAAFEIENPMLDCCRLMPDIFDRARKIERTQQTPVIAVSMKIPSPEFSIIENKFNAPQFYRPPVLDRGGTYLKNRVFRI